MTKKQEQIQVLKTTLKKASRVLIVQFIANNGPVIVKKITEMEATKKLAEQHPEAVQKAKSYAISKGLLEDEKKVSNRKKAVKIAGFTTLGLLSSLATLGAGAVVALFEIERKYND